MTTEIFKCHQNSLLFDAQNARNRISKLLDFKRFGGACPQTPLARRMGPFGPFSSHSRLLHFQCQLITNVIKIPWIDELCIIHNQYLETNRI